MLPNVLQYPVVLCGIFRAGLVVVNVNPLYTARELQHQLADSGAKAIVILENFAHVLETIIDATEVRHVITTSVGDSAGEAEGLDPGLRDPLHQKVGAEVRAAGSGPVPPRARAR